MPVPLPSLTDIPLLPFLSLHLTPIAILPTAPFLAPTLPARRSELLRKISWANNAWRKHVHDEEPSTKSPAATPTGSVSNGRHVTSHSASSSISTSASTTPTAFQSSHSSIGSNFSNPEASNSFFTAEDGEYGLPAHLGSSADHEQLATELAMRFPRDGSSRSIELAVAQTVITVTILPKEGYLVITAPKKRGMVDPQGWGIGAGVATQVGGTAENGTQLSDATEEIEEGVPDAHEVALRVQDEQPSAGMKQFLESIRQTEMGKRIADYPWHTTLMGAITTWSVSLRALLGTMLASPFRQYIVWGREYILLYNDAYIEAALTKHPWILGKPLVEAWPEAFPLIKDIMADAMEGKSFAIFNHHLPLERNGIFEETYHSYCFTPVSDESGRIQGLFNINFETTSERVSERRFATVQDLVLRTNSTRSVADFCAKAVEALEENPFDLPFVLLYIAETADAKFNKREVNLLNRRKAIKLFCRGTVGIPAGHPFLVQDTHVDLAPPVQTGSESASTSQSPLDGSESFSWPFETACRTKQPVYLSDISALASTLPGRAWGDNPTGAVVVPIFAEGTEAPRAVIVIGLNPRCDPQSELYTTFRQIITRHLGIGLLSVRAAEEDARRSDELVALDRAKTSFFNSSSHELRTPLTLVLGPLEDVLNSKEILLPREARDRLEVVSRNATRLLALVNKLLDFSALEGGKLDMKLQPVKLGEFTTSLASLFRDAVERAGLRLTVDCEDDPPSSYPIYTSKELYTRAFFNILGNALKYSPFGSITVRVRTTREDATLEVQDTGIGIPQNELGNIFERFHRVERSANSVSGTGIGLALTLEICKSLGGDLQVESEVGVGSTFSIKFQRGYTHLSAAHVSHDPEAELYEMAEKLSSAEIREATSFRTSNLGDQIAMVSGRSSLGSALSSADHDYFGPQDMLNLKSSTILVADDNPDLRAYIGSLLRKFYNVVEVADGKAALEYALTHPPSLVLTDVGMPRLSGDELFRALRENPTTATIPVIFISAHASEEARTHALEEGADDFITKPFSSREMLARVKVHLQLSKMRLELESRVRERTGELNESELRYRALAQKYTTILDVTPVGIFMMDSAGLLVYTNPRFHWITGHPTDRALSLWEETVDPQDLPIFKSWQQSFIGGQDSGSIQCRFQGMASSTWVQLEFCKVTEFGPDVAYIGTVTDITAQKEIEALHIESIEQRAADAETHRRHIENFIDIASHEIRNPLSGVVQNAEIISHSLQDIMTIFDTGKLPEGAELNELSQEMRENLDAVQNILVCAAHQGRIADDILNASKYDMGLLTVNPAAFDIVSKMNEVIKMLEADCAKKGIDLHLIISDSIHKLDARLIFADANRLAQTAVNFLLNGLKFTVSPGKLSLHLSASETPPRYQPGVMRVGDARETGPDEIWVVVGVEDTGKGLTPKEMERLFERFSQSNPNHDQYEGAGLGLYVSRQLIVELHRGFIEVESSGVSGKGSIFRFAIPVERGPPLSAVVERPNLANRGSSTSTIPSKRKVKRIFGGDAASFADDPTLPTHILVVEDNDINRKVLTRQLTNEKFRVTTACNGQEALDILLAPIAPKDVIHCILLDIEMPIMGGVEAIRRIRAKEVEMEAPLRYTVFALTGNAREEQKDQYLSEGFTDVIIKPYSSKRLVAKILEVRNLDSPEL